MGSHALSPRLARRASWGKGPASPTRATAKTSTCTPRLATWREASEQSPAPPKRCPTFYRRGLGPWRLSSQVRDRMGTGMMPDMGRHSPRHDCRVVKHQQSEKPQIKGCLAGAEPSSQSHTYRNQVASPSPGTLLPFEEAPVCVSSPSTRTVGSSITRSAHMALAPRKWMPQAALPGSPKAPPKEMCGTSRAPWLAPHFIPTEDGVEGHV